MNIQDPYIEYNLDDFFWDEKFRKDVLAGPSSFSYWENWLLINPTKRKIVEKASLMILSVQVENVHISEDEIQQMIFDTQRILGGDELETTDEPLQITKKRDYSYLLIAASFLFFILGWFWVENKKNITLSNASTYENLIKKVSNKLIERINNTNAPLIVVLPDGSKITLSKNSKISYPEKFAQLEKREVFLRGEAFFEVTRNPQKPFFVFADGLVTKVLGTKFKVRSYEIDKDVIVEVASGKVSVFANKLAIPEEKKSFNELSSIVLVANQKVTFSKEDASIVKTLVNEPIYLKPDGDTKKLFNFENSRLKEVFEVLSSLYGIDILFDEELSAECTLTANLEGYTLFEQLTIICKALNGSYEVLDGRVIVTSKGCKK